MLLYNNHSLWRVIFQLQGSVFFKPWRMLFGFAIAGITAGLSYLIDENHDLAPSLPHHYGILGISSIVVFAVVFRINLAWGRYWEAMTQQHFMYSKWADAFAQFCAFANVTLTAIGTRKDGDKDCADWAAKSHKIYYTMHNLRKHFSLLSAVAADRLTHGDTRIMEKKTRKDSWSSQVVLRGELRDDVNLEEYLELPEFAHIDEMPISLGSKRTVTIAELAEPLDEEGWRQRFYVMECPNEEEIRYLKTSTDRVSTVMYWILHDLASVSNDLVVAPPIQSRMYQELSNGMLGFSNSLKIADVPFPFPYAQLVNMALVAFSFFIPVYVSIFTTSLIASPILAFCFFEGLWCFNAVAKELENPFGCDANGISLEDFHMRFMSNIRDLEPAQEFKTASLVTALEAVTNSRESYRADDEDDRMSILVNHNSMIGREASIEEDFLMQSQRSKSMRQSHDAHHHHHLMVTPGMQMPSGTRGSRLLAANGQPNTADWMSMEQSNLRNSTLGISAASSLGFEQPSLRSTSTMGMSAASSLGMSATSSQRGMRNRMLNTSPRQSMRKEDQTLHGLHNVANNPLWESDKEKEEKEESEEWKQTNGEGMELDMVVVRSRGSASAGSTKGSGCPNSADNAPPDPIHESTTTGGSTAAGGGAATETRQQEADLAVSGPSGQLHRCGQPRDDSHPQDGTHSSTAKRVSGRQARLPSARVFFS